MNNLTIRRHDLPFWAPRLITNCIVRAIIISNMWNESFLGSLQLPHSSITISIFFLRYYLRDIFIHLHIFIKFMTMFLGYSQKSVWPLHFTTGSDSGLCKNHIVLICHFTTQLHKLYLGICLLVNPILWKFREHAILITSILSLRMSTENAAFLSTCNVHISTFEFLRKG
jgi:hypothetical protein